MDEPRIKHVATTRIVAVERTIPLTGPSTAGAAGGGGGGGISAADERKTA